MNKVEAREIIAIELAKASAESRKIVEDGYAGEGGYWGVRKSGLLSYQETFGSVLPLPIQVYLDMFKPEKERVYGLDLMGEAEPLRDLRIKGLGVTLIDDRNLKSRVYDQARGIEIIGTTFDSGGKIRELADIFSKNTRRRIRSYIMENNIPGFDLIFCRPVGAVGMIPEEATTAYYLLQSAYNMLHPDHGMLLTQIPNARMDILPEWILELQSQGIDARYKSYELFTDGVLSVIRYLDSPAKLPTVDVYAESY